MERLDLEHPDPAGLAGMALAELGLEEQVDVAALAGELAGMLDRLKASPLWEQLRSARRTWRELEFTALAGPAVLRGKIDLLYEDADGVFHLLDYKSDRVAGDLADHAQRYRLQMLLYAGAASRFLAARGLVDGDHGRDARGTHGQARKGPFGDARATNYGPAGQPAAVRRGSDDHGQARKGPFGDARATGDAHPTLGDATLYVLRSGQTHVFAADAASLVSAQAELGELTGRITAARRSGRYEHAAGEHCQFCPYGILCSARCLSGTDTETR